MTDDLRSLLAIPSDRLDEINAIFTDPDVRVVNDFLSIIRKYGSPEEINAKAMAARDPERLREKLEEVNPDHLEGLDWLEEMRDEGAFISESEYRRKILGDKADQIEFKDDFAVTLEISACQYYPWVLDIAQRAIDDQLVMPGRFIRVRKMKEQEQDGDLPAMIAAMQIIGASYVETLDTKGTDGSNIHLGGPETITGYFGGVGQPNDHAVEWLDEFLYYYTEYGIEQVLNINPGTVLLGYMLHKIGVDIEFKISVYMGNDNPYAALWTLIGAKLFSRDDGTTPLIGFNWSNSINNETMEITAQFRKMLGFTDIVRFEHHITETFKSIVIQPYNRRAELVDIADHVANISAKHEGGEPELEEKLDYPSDILDYFRDKEEILEAGEWESVSHNFMQKFLSVNNTAKALTEHGLSFIAARKLHHS
ncbi:MAG: hypothetical protein PVI81_04710 [Anaerolineales bacterium]|jgi:hypothetical protein